MIRPPFVSVLRAKEQGVRRLSVLVTEPKLFATCIDHCWLSDHIAGSQLKMAFLRTPIVLLLTQILLFLGLVNAVPTPESLDVHGNLARDTASSFWVANIKRQGAVAFGQSSGYQVYRNVKDFGAKGKSPSTETRVFS